MTDYSDIHIEWQSEVTAKMGYGLQTRRMLKPLLDGGAKIKLIPDEDYLPPHMKIQDSYWTDKIEEGNLLEPAPIRIMHCLPNRYRPEKGKINIGYSMWETTQLPRESVHHINNTCNYFWAGGSSLAEVAKNSGISCPVLPVSPTLDTSEWTPDGPKLNINEVPKEDVKFLFIGNFIPRKNLEALVVAFSVAFEGIEDASLTIKSFAAANTSQAKKHISGAIKNMVNKANNLKRRPKISVVTDLLEEEHMKSLIRGCDVYVTASKGERFDYSLAQAMSMEKLVVADQFLSHKDYINQDNAIPVNHTLTPCIEANAPLYGAYQMWSSPDMGNLISSMQLAYTTVKHNTHKHLRENARKTITDKFGVQASTEALANTIRDIAKGIHAPQKPEIRNAIQQLVSGPR